MTTLRSAEHILDETLEARARASALLESLERAKEESERRLAANSRPDHLKQVTGRSSLDNAIDSTRRMIAALDRAVRDAERRLGDGGYEVVARVSQPAGASGSRWSGRVASAR